MRLKQSAVAFAVLCGTWACAGPPPPPPPAQTTALTIGHVVDLGHPLAATDPSWDGKPAFSYKPLASIAKDGYFLGEFTSEEHFGTHVDAPAHFAPDGITVDRIPAARLVRPAVVIDISGKVKADEDYRLTAADVQDFERAHGQIAEATVVFIATGWDSRWPDAARYMNVRAGVKHFPGLSVEAARYLGADRKVAGIGIDTASIDYGPSEKFEAHQTTMPLGVYHIENVANLLSLPATGWTVVVAPIKISGGSGGPARVFALLP